MKVGSIVYSRYPRRDGRGTGIVIKYYESHRLEGRIIAPRVEVYWTLTGNTHWYKGWDLEVLV